MKGSSRTVAEERLVGREDVLERLRAELEALQSTGQGRVMLVTGGQGLGKSRVATAVSEMAKLAGLQRVVVRVAPAAVPRAYDLFANMTTDLSTPVERWAAAAAGPSPDVPIAGSGALAEGVESDLSAGPRLDAVARAPEHLHEQVVEWQRRVESRAKEWLLQITFRGSLLFLVEDLHAADEESRLLVAQMIPELLARPVWLVVTTDPAKEFGEVMGRSLRAAESAGRLARIELRNLDRLETERFVRSLEPSRGEPLVPQVIDQLYAISQGNPFLVEHLLPYLREGVPGAAIERTPPIGVADLFRRLVSTVPPQDRRVLAYASVIGPEFDFPLLTRATGEEEEPLAEVVERLHKNGLLVERGPDRFAFLTRTIRDIAYGGLSHIRRRILHQKIAHALEADGGASNPLRQVELAGHFAEGGEPEKAARAYDSAAEVAEARLDLKFAAECIRRAYEIERARALRTPVDLAKRLDRLAALWRQAGTPVEEKKASEEAVHLLESAAADPTVLAQLWVTLARASMDSGEQERARALLERALPVLESTGEATAVGRAYRLLGNVYYAAGQYRDALGFYHLARDAIRDGADQAELGRATLSIADAQLMIDPTHPEKAVEWFAQATEVLEKAHDEHGLLFAELVTAAAARLLGRKEDHRRHQASMLSRSTTVPLGSRVAKAILRKAEQHLERDEPRVAIVLLEELALIADPSAEPELTSAVKLRLGEAYLADGALGRAAETLQLLEAGSYEISDARLAECRLALGLIAFRSGRAEEARELLRNGPRATPSLPEVISREVERARTELGLKTEEHRETNGRS